MLPSQHKQPCQLIDSNSTSNIKVAPPAQTATNMSMSIDPGTSEADAGIGCGPVRQLRQANSPEHYRLETTKLVCLDQLKALHTPGIFSPAPRSP